MNQLQQSIQKFLKQEKEAMEERIRTFTEQEKAKFEALQAELQKKIGNGDELMCFLLSSLQQNDVKKDQIIMENKPKTHSDVNSSNDLDNNTAPVQVDNQRFHVQPVNVEIQKKALAVVQPSSIPTRPNLNIAPHHATKRVRSHSVDAGIFDIDLEDEMDERFSSDDEIDVGIHAEELDENNISQSIEQSAQNNQFAYARSLPIQINSFKLPNHDIDEKMSRINQVPNEKKDIAADIAQLAASIRADEVEQVFGPIPERPYQRTRMNTGEIIRSRPV